VSCFVQEEWAIGVFGRVGGWVWWDGGVERYSISSSCRE
jgi:hypothetical protein